VSQLRVLCTRETERLAQDENDVQKYQHCSRQQIADGRRVARAPEQMTAHYGATKNILHAGVSASFASAPKNFLDLQS
jgi:hypothetical protein